MWDYTDIFYKDSITDIIIVKKGSLTNQLFIFMSEFRPLINKKSHKGLIVVTEINCFQK